MNDLDICVGHRSNLREAVELRNTLADTLCGLGVQDLYCVGIDAPKPGRKGFKVSLCALFDMEESPIDIPDRRTPDI